MKSSDLAWLLTIIELSSAPYKRKDSVREEIQRKYDTSRRTKQRAITIRITTQHGEALSGSRD